MTHLSLPDYSVLCYVDRAIPRVSKKQKQTTFSSSRVTFARSLTTFASSRVSQQERQPLLLLPLQGDEQRVAEQGKRRRTREATFARSRLKANKRRGKRSKGCATTRKGSCRQPLLVDLQRQEERQEEEEPR